MRVFVFIVLLSLVGMSVHAQDSTSIRKSFSFSQGLLHIVNKDLYRSPYTYSGLNSLTELKFERTSPKYMHRAGARFAFGSVKTFFSPLASDNYANVNYSCSRKLSVGKKHELYVGPMVDVLSWRVNYFPEMRVPDYGKVRSYLLSESVGAAAVYKYQIGRKSSLSIYTSLPIASYVDRPAFLDGNGRQTSLGAFNFWNPQIKVVYEWNVSEKVALFASYRYSYLSYSKPKSIFMMDNSFTVGLKLSF